MGTCLCPFLRVSERAEIARDHLRDTAIFICVCVCAIVRIFQRSVQRICDELIIYLFIYDSTRVKWSLLDLELWIRLPTTGGIHFYHIFHVHFPCKKTKQTIKVKMPCATRVTVFSLRKHRQHGQWALCTDHRPGGTCSVSQTAYTRPLCPLQSIKSYKKCALLITVGRIEWKQYIEGIAKWPANVKRNETHSYAMDRFAWMRNGRATSQPWADDHPISIVQPTRS